MDERDYGQFSAMLGELADYYGKPQSAAMLRIQFRALGSYPIGVVRAALDAHVADPQRGRWYPLAADVIAQVQAMQAADGRPGADEAWAMIPMDEDGSCVWTDEMAAAYGVAAPLLSAGDRIAARMAFRDAYTARVAAARAEGRTTRWTPSLGRDPDARVAALTAAAQAGRLQSDHVTRLLPAMPVTPAGSALIAGGRKALQVSA